MNVLTGSARSWTHVKRVDKNSSIKASYLIPDTRKRWDGDMKIHSFCVNKNRLKMGKLLEAVLCHDPLRYHRSIVFQSLLLTRVIHSFPVLIPFDLKSLQSSTIIHAYTKLSSWRSSFLLMIFPSQILDLLQLLSWGHFGPGYGDGAEAFISTSRRISFHLEHRMTVRWVCPRSACECLNSLVKTAAGIKF